MIITYKIALFFFIIFFSSQIIAQKTAQEKPNIVFVLADQWRAQATGYGGDPNVRTPQLNKLAGTAVNFTNTISTLPVCTPYRAAFLTGRYPQSTGMFLNDLHLPDEEFTLAEIFSQAGYNTGYIGKWHLDGHGRMTYIPKERRQGFDYWKANECSHNYNHSLYYFNDDTTMRYWKGYDAYDQTKDAIAYINRNSDDKKPFVLVLGYGVPHFPHNSAPENYKKEYSNKKLVLPPNVPENQRKSALQEAIGYYAHCTALDSCVGLLKEAIKENGIEENTIFVFTSDHGEMLGSHGVRPYAKQRFWEESIQVPFLISYPKLTGFMGREITTPLGTPDILPTLLGLCGIKIPGKIQGEDLSSLISGKKKDIERAVLFMSIVPSDENSKGLAFRGVRTSRYSYIKQVDGSEILFDNQKDIYQLNNLANDKTYSSIKKNLKKQLLKQLAKLGDEIKEPSYYLAEFGLKLDETGKVSYGVGPYEPQIPKSNKRK